ncbi:hypothetical protein SNE40_002538 [Patella caerulea]|uniref:RNA helicase n=1 Tax=Patella caerulea TaxID=87958 RepID=A0AAN8K630_PATCE
MSNRGGRGKRGQGGRGGRQNPSFHQRDQNPSNSSKQQSHTESRGNAKSNRGQAPRRGQAHDNRGYHHGNRSETHVSRDTDYRESNTRDEYTQPSYHDRRRDDRNDSRISSERIEDLRRSSAHGRDTEDYKHDNRGYNRDERRLFSPKRHDDRERKRFSPDGRRHDKVRNSPDRRHDEQSRYIHEYRDGRHYSPKDRDGRRYSPECRDSRHYSPERRGRHYSPEHRSARHYSPDHRDSGHYNPDRRDDRHYRSDHRDSRHCSPDRWDGRRHSPDIQKGRRYSPDRRGSSRRYSPERCVKEDKRESTIVNVYMVPEKKNTSDKEQNQDRRSYISEPTLGITPGPQLSYLTPARYTPALPGGGILPTPGSYSPANSIPHMVHAHQFMVPPPPLMGGIGNQGSSMPSFSIPSNQPLSSNYGSTYRYKSQSSGKNGGSRPSSTSSSQSMPSDMRGSRQNLLETKASTGMRSMPSNMTGSKSDIRGGHTRGLGGTSRNSNRSGQNKHDGGDNIFKSSNQMNAEVLEKHPKTGKNPTLLFMVFKNKNDDSFDYTSCLNKRTETLKNLDYMIELFKTVGNDRILLVSFPSKSASTKVIKLFRKTNSSSDVEILCFVKQDLPDYLSALKSVDTETKRNPDNKDVQQEQKVRKARKKKRVDDSEAKQVRKRETNVYITVFDTVKSEDMEGFLKTRMGSGFVYPFKLIASKIDDKGTKSEVIIQFPSEAMALSAMNSIGDSNVDSPTQITCSMTPSSDASDTKEERLSKLLADIQTRSDYKLKDHGVKIQAALEDISQVVIKQNISVAEYQRRMEEKSALESKLIELRSQETEYCSFLSRVKTRLSESVMSDDFDTILTHQSKSFGIESCRLDSALPIYARRADIVECVKNNQVTIIRGETGSGKSTQMVQYLYENLSSNKMIVCTQPRKVACINLASRVAEELLLPLGQDVGYKTGMKYKTSDKTKIVFMTDHSLLNECLKDPLLKKYSCVIIDEAHERSIYTDLLLGIVKKCLPQRNDLRVIISSATIDIKVFSDYFKGSQSMQIAGRTFPVEEIWLSDEEHAKLDSYMDGAVKLAVKIHKEKHEGDILIFMTTPLETEKCKESLEKILGHTNDYICLPLHGQLHADEQQAVFRNLAKGIRKIVFATNTAETSITIPGVKFVIDTGLAKEMNFDPKRGINTLSVETISKSSAEQRKGRAGRTAAGTCYRLYSQKSYQDMKSTNIPEILRVHLGQVLLKLLELNVNPNECDFVESPNPDAIASALRNLEELKAMDGYKITEQGKWLAKIPFEPQLGTIVKLGFDNGLVYDALVLTTLISTGSYIFYRGGSDAEKDNLDLLKTTFCDSRGDCFTFLNVYKEWINQPENKKSKWCFDNGINSKAIRGARETITEIASVLKKELNIEVKREFSNDEKALEILQKIITLSFRNNISHYIGHEKAGYFVPILNQQVYLHPSSVLKTLNNTSEWVVYTNILQTSKYFITTVTPVKEEWVLEIMKENKLFDIDEAKKKKISNIHTECFGPTSFSFFVGPRYTKIRNYESILTEKCSSIVMLEADRDRGEVRVFSSEFTLDAKAALAEWVNEARNAVENRSTEYRLGTKESKSGGVRIVLGSGGEGKLILMPNEYRTVFITKPNSKTTSKERIIEKFSKFGDIADCWEEKRSNQRWGRVTFTSRIAAVAAVEGTKTDVDEVAIPEFKLSENPDGFFKTRLIWSRRPSKGMAFVDIELLCLAKAVTLGSINVLGNLAQVSLDAKSTTSLCVRKIPLTATETDVRNSVCEAMGYITEEDRQNVHRVTVVREKAFTSTPHILESIRTEIEERIVQVIGCKEFTVDIMKPRKDGDTIYKANVKFSRPDHGKLACKRLNGILNIGGQTVEMTPDISSYMNVSRHVYDLMKGTVEETIQAMNFLEFRHHVKLLDNDRVMINLYSTKPDDLARVKSVLEGILKGEVIECWRNENYRHLFLKSGRKFMRDVQERTSTYIQVDERQYTISIYGTTANFTSAQTEFQNHLNEILLGTGKEIDLRAPGQPNGLMKKLIKEYGMNLEKFVDKCNLKSALLDHKRQLVKLIGDPQNIDQAISVILVMSKNLTKNQQQTSTVQEEFPECCACLCPIEDTSQLYRLEYCGHAYCFDCLGQQITVAIQSKDIPILCSEEECQKPLVWNDFVNSFKKAQVNPNALLGSAVTRFMMNDKDDAYRHCLTPDCPMIYRVTSDGIVFSCYECGIRICTTCHVEYHDGLSCQQYKANVMDKLQVEIYLKEFGNTTKHCPGCNILIEKNYGCNHMVCSACKISFCWLCSASFASSGLCYDHLNTVHGGITTEDDLLYD